MAEKTSTSGDGLPVAPVEVVLGPVRRFLHIEAASGVVLLLAAVVALVVANSPWAENFAAFWHTPISLTIGTFHLKGDLGHLFVNDGLMTIFFFVVGLEIKREIIAGELREPAKAMLPIVAALGGMVVPALIYLGMQWGQEGQRGWAVPMATDIAFVVGFLALFGKRVPFGLKILLLSLAIVDDLGAVLIIALVFSSGLKLGWLAAAACGLLVTYTLNRLGVRAVAVYVVVGVFIWLAVHESGVHATVAGVLLGLLTPASAWVGDRTLTDVVRKAWKKISGETPADGDEQRTARERLQFAARESVSPLDRLETALHPWVAFGIMPLFALANAGVPLKADAVWQPVALAVALGLLVGKPVGIVLFSWLAIRVGITKLPEGVTWGIFIGGACLGGIGFTMALFLAGLAFTNETLYAAAKIGTLSGSILAALLGVVILLMTTGSSRPQQEGT